MAGTTRDMMLKKIVEDEEVEEKKGGKSFHKSTHHKTRKNQMDFDKQQEAERKEKEKEKQGSMKDVQQMSEKQVRDLFKALKASHKSKTPTTTFEGKVYDTGIIGPVDDHIAKNFKQGGGGGGGFSKNYQAWVQSKFQKQIQSGMSPDKIYNDPKVQGSYTSETGQKP